MHSSYEGHAIANADWFDYLGTRFYKSFQNTKAHVKKNLAIRLAKAETAFTLLRRRCGCCCDLHRQRVTLMDGSEILYVQIQR